MLKITHKEIAKLTGLTEGYVRQLLFRRGIALKQADMERVIDLIAEYRGKE